MNYGQSYWLLGGKGEGEMEEEAPLVGNVFLHCVATTDNKIYLLAIGQGGQAQPKPRQILLLLI